MIELDTGRWEDFSIQEKASTEIFDALSNSIIGQDEALRKISKVVLTWMNEDTRQEPVKPTVLLLMGPSGTGKTQTVKEISKFIYGNDKIPRINCGQFNMGHQTHSLIGAPAGYIGYDHKSIFEQNKSYFGGTDSILLIDEVDKAHPDILRLFLNILDEGKVTLGNGKEVVFRNTLIVMTSNVGAEEMSNIMKEHTAGFIHRPNIGKDIKDVAYQAFENDKKFTPEFRGRIDHVVCFTTLDFSALTQIVLDLEKKVQEFLAPLGVFFDMDNAVVEYFARKGIDPRFIDMGVRSIKSAISEKILSKLKDAKAEGILHIGEHIRAFLFDDEKIKFCIKKWDDRNN